LANCLTLRGPRPRRTGARLVPCRATAGLPRASSCKPATIWPPRVSRCRSPCACRRWALCASHHWATACEPSPSTSSVPREPSPGCRVRAAASRLCDHRAFLLADSREAHMVFGFWSRSKEERGCLPALANFRAWLPHSKQIIERSHGRNKGIRTGVTGKGDGLRLWTVNQLARLGEEDIGGDL